MKSARETKPALQRRARPATPGSPDRSVPAAWSVPVGLIAVACYLALAPTVSGDKDSAEFTLVLALNGVAHPTGYPLFTLFGHLWTKLVHSLGATWAYAANSWSALGGGVAIGLLHRLGCVLVPPGVPLGRWQRFLLALLPVALLAPNPIWTYETTLAEVYAWHVAWVMGASVCFIHIVRTTAGEDDPPVHALRARAAAWGLLCGLGASHHATALFVVAPLSLALLVVLVLRRRLRLVLVLTALVAALVPLSSYGIIYWRATHPAAFQWSELRPGWDGLLEHVTGRKYQILIGRFMPSREQDWLLARYVWPFLLPGLVLLVLNAVRSRGLAARGTSWGIAVAAFAGTAYAVRYGVSDPSSYFLYPMTLALAAVTPLSVWLWGRGAISRRIARALVPMLAVAAVGLAVPWVRTDMQRVRLYEDFDRYVHSMWESIPFDTAFVFWRNDMYTKLTEYQLLRGEKAGVFVYHPTALLNPAPRARFVARHGFDPGAGLVLEQHFPMSPATMESMNVQAAAYVERHVNEMTSVPVIHFDPEQRTVRLLVKPRGGEASRDSLAIPAAHPTPP